MVKLTIAVPVFNGEECLEACLESIVNQSYDDFRVLIFDNNSTDATPKIAKEVASRDSRVSYFRNDENIGAGNNFLKSLSAAETEFFAWRSDDDLSSNNYFELLVQSLENYPNAALAAGHVERHVPVEGKLKHFPYIRETGTIRVIDTLRMMFHSNPAWIYGVWRTERLRKYNSSVLSQYTEIWAKDHLVLLSAILDRAVVGDERAVFIQRLRMRRRDEMSRQARPVYSTRIRYMEELRPVFLDCCTTALNQSNWNHLERVALRLAMKSYSRKRIGATRLKMASLKIRRRLFED